MDPTIVSHGIQLAVAPVFLLTAVAALIGSFATRLARIVDRARLLEEKLEAESLKNTRAAHWELKRLRLRGRMVSASMAMLTICSLMIGITIMALFLGETTELHIQRLVPLSFLAGVIFFLLALFGFLIETMLAMHVLRFGRNTDKNS
jgi:MFS family permease